MQFECSMYDIKKWMINPYNVSESRESVCFYVNDVLLYDIMSCMF